MNQEELKNILNYDLETGIFTWKVNRSQKKIGDIAGSPDKDGYIKITFKKKHYFAHRLAFLYILGDIPKQVDHIDGIKDNNKWSNLRPATLSQNQGNRKLQENNTSGMKGVYFIKTKYKLKKPWRAQIYKNSKTIIIGQFETKEEAAKAYNYAALAYFGEFAKLNIIK